MQLLLIAGFFVMDARREELAKAAARLVVFGFSGKTIDHHARALLRAGAGGVILFSRNFETPEQVAQLCKDLKKEAGSRPLIIMVDQEGGHVSRLAPPFTQLPSARVVGKAGAAAATGKILGKELRAVHIDMNLAPVLDVDTNPDNPVIGQRSFSSDPERVAELGYQFITSIQAEGVAACAKHFPGHGDTSLDSHVSLPSLEHSMQRLESVELIPFAKSVTANVAAVMTAHIKASAFESGDVPVTMSGGAIDYLRSKLGFQGVVMSDCLEMGAITERFRCDDAAVRAVEAGVDMLLVCHRRERQLAVISGLVEAVESGKLRAERVEQAGERIDKLLEKFVQPFGCSDKSLEVIGCKEHLDTVENILKKI